MLDFKVEDNKPVYPIEHHVEQGTEEWLSLRVGKMTASNFGKIMPTDSAIKRGDKSFSDTAKKYLYEVASEILTGESAESGFMNDAMRWGNDMEPIARDSISEFMKLDIRECGFYELSPVIGDSPDGLFTGGSGVLEIKCPYSSAIHLQNFNDHAQFWKKHRWQVIGHMLCTGDHSGLLVSFDPRMPKSKSMALCDPPKGYKDDIKRLEERLFDACAVIAGMIK